MNKKVIITLFIIVTHFRSVIASNVPTIDLNHGDNFIAEQVESEIHNSICCRIATCQLRSIREQYNSDSSHHENCDTPINALQSVLRCIGCPIQAVGILAFPCWIPCIECYRCYRSNQIKRENAIYENVMRDLMNNDNNNLPIATPINSHRLPRVITRNSHRLPRATVIYYNNIVIAPATRINDTSVSIIALNIQDEL